MLCNEQYFFCSNFSTFLFYSSDFFTPSHIIVSYNSHRKINFLRSVGKYKKKRVSRTSENGCVFAFYAWICGIHINGLQFVQMIKLNKTVDSSSRFFVHSYGVCFCVWSSYILLLLLLCCCANGIRPVIIKHLAFAPLPRFIVFYISRKVRRLAFLSYRFTAFSYAFMAFCYFLERNFTLLDARLLPNKIYCFTSMECRKQ